MQKILVIEDDSELLVLVTCALRFCGFNTCEATDGEEGIRLAKEQKPDAILCDIHLPKVDGYSTLSAIRSDESTAKIPFAFITGDIERANLDRASATGVGCLKKPFRQRQLHDFVVKL